jgi:hypothetical protein
MNDPIPMTNPDFVKWVLTFGVGGVLALVMFLVHRKDSQRNIDQWKGTAEVLMAVVRDNTASNIKLITMIETMERNAVRKQDVLDLIAQQQEQRRVLREHK